MNKIRNSSLFLLWAGAAISISEIYTGGIIAPLGLAKGMAAILIGHVIGTLLLAFGGYISFKNKKNAMDSVKDALGDWGARLVALLNITQLLGWSAIMIIQGGRALSQVFSGFSYNLALLFMAAAVALWAYFFNTRTKSINDISVILLVLMCITLFWRHQAVAAMPVGGSLSFAAAVELSIAMPVSWLPLIGDYTMNAESGSGAFSFSFWGYFIGSVLMYALGLFIAVQTGMDVIGFIAASSFRWLACSIVVLSTATTTFLDIWSAVISSKQLFHIKCENLWLMMYSVVVTFLAFVFPMEQYQNFLLTIGSVFVPVYTVIFADYLLSRQTGAFNPKQISFNLTGMLLACAGTALYICLTRSGFGLPTLVVITALAALYFSSSKISRALGKNIMN